MHNQSLSRRCNRLLQRELRRTMTDAEQALWRMLRRRQMDGCRFRRQHPIDRFIVDFVCLEKKLIIEVDGGQHASAHAPDQARDDHLRLLGFTVLRFWNDDVLLKAESVGERIWIALQERTPTPPSP